MFFSYFQKLQKMLSVRNVGGYGVPHPRSAHLPSGKLRRPKWGHRRFSPVGAGSDPGSATSWLCVLGQVVSPHCLCLPAAVQGHHVCCLRRVPGDREWHCGPWDVVVLSACSAGSHHHHESTWGASWEPGGPRIPEWDIGILALKWWEPQQALE